MPPEVAAVRAAEMQQSKQQSCIIQPFEQTQLKAQDELTRLRGYPHTKQYQEQVAESIVHWQLEKKYSEELM
jgi:hypothetical protein